MTTDRAVGTGRSDAPRMYAEHECAARLTTLLAPHESKTEIFDIAEWHAHDPIHFRVLMCADIAQERGCRDYIDYGSGIGSDALVFASVGCRVTLADVSEPLLAFAKWRCERRGVEVATIDLKRGRPPRRHFDAVACFDVLEHIHRPLRTLWTIQHSMRPGGMLFMHAPFGLDPDRPMHVVHKDVVTRGMRTVGFHRRVDLETRFPECSGTLSCTSPSTCRHSIGLATACATNG